MLFISSFVLQESKPFHCDTCGQRFACLSHRRDHIDAVHKSEFACFYPNEVLKVRVLNKLFIFYA